jgi:Flp pilus assembly protein TadG
MTADFKSRLAPARNEAGVFTAFVALLAVSLLLIVGMAVDSGRAIADQRLVAGEAEQAARAGAGQLSVEGLRAGRVVLNDAAAVRVAEQFTQSVGHPGIATVRDGTVTVRVVVAVPTTILSMIGVRSIAVTAAASASDVQGLTRQD